MIDPELKQILLSKYGNSEKNPFQQMGFHDKLSSIADEIKSRQIGSKLETMFMQTLDNQNGIPNAEFNQSLISLTNKNTLALMFGASIAGQVGGLFSRFIPINMGIGGLPAIAGGYILSKYVLKSGLGHDMARGIMIGGGAVAISGFTGQFNLGFLGGGSAPAVNTGGGGAYQY